MTIRVYPSLLPGEPIETHEWTGTIGAWLDSKGIDYLTKDTQLVAIFVNGAEVSPDEWAHTKVGHSDTVDIKVLPHGIELIIAAVVAIVAIAAVMIFMPKPGQPGRNQTAQGQKFETADGQANGVKFGDVVPELAGRFRRYPDYLTPPRRYFASPREQWLEFLCCVGPGHYQINPYDVRISDSEFASLGANASYGIHSPGTNLSGVAAHEHWHSASEVGGTASGTVGLELSVDMASSVNTQPVEYTFSGLTITRTDGDFPVGWGPGTVISVEIPKTATYDVTGGGFTPNVFTGDFGHLMPLVENYLLLASGAGIAGIFIARSVAVNGAGVGGLQLWTIPVEATDSSPEIPSEPVTSAATGDKVMTFSHATPRTYTLIAASSEFVTVSSASFPAITSPATIKYHSGAVYGEWSSTFAACPPAEKTSLIEIDFFFPAGLTVISDEGDLEGRSVGVEIQYRDANATGSFTSVMKTYSNSTLDQIGYTEQIAVSNIRPEVKVRRVGATSTSTQIQDTVHWYGMKSKLPTRTNYPNWTTMSVRIRSGGRLAAQSENQINVIATRILPVLQGDGSWGVPQPTREITAFAKYIASTIGYTDDDLEMAEFARLNSLWQGRGETFDYVFDETTVKEALNTSFGAGMAELTVDDGKIKPVRDGVRSQFEHSYSPQNMTGPLRRSFRAPKHDDTDGVEVEYIDGDTWAKEVVRCFLPEDQGFKIAKIKVDGVLSRTTAWRIGMRHRRALRYRNWEYSFSTELDALNSGYMSYVPLYDDIPGYGQSAILEAIEPTEDGAMLHVSEPLRWEAGQAHVVGYRRPDGTLAGPWAATKGADNYSVIANIPKPWPIVTLKMEPPHVYFGTAERWTFPALITDIKPKGLESVNVTAINYDARVYADDDSQPPAA